MAQAMVEITELHKHFGKLAVLHGVSLSVAAGEVVVIIGASGSGKTTLLRCINHLEIPDGGEVRVDGIRLTDRAADIRAVRVECGMVFQQFNLYPHLTVLDNVTLGPRVVRKVPRRKAEAMAIAVDHDVDIIRIIECNRGPIERRLIEMPVRRPLFP